MKPLSREERQAMRARCARVLAEADHRAVFSDKPTAEEVMRQAIAKAQVSSAIELLNDDEDGACDA